MKVGTVLSWLLLIVLVLLIIGLADGAPGPLAAVTRAIVAQVGVGMVTAGGWLQQVAS